MEEKTPTSVEDTAQTTSILTRALQVAVIAATIFAGILACTPYKYVKTPDLRPDLVKINTEATACAKPVTFNQVGMLPVKFDKLIIDNKTILTISPDSVENLTTNLSQISGSVEDRAKYIEYLRQCLTNIATNSVVKDDDG